MGDSTSIRTSGGIGFGGILTLIFVILKLGVGWITEVMNWSWGLVFLPLIISVVVSILLFVGTILFAAWASD